MPHETVIYRRDDLYGLVWSKPMRQVAKTFGVSDVALAKICRRLGVPVPGRGHWARVTAGQRVKRRPLAPLKAGQPAEIHAQRSRPLPIEGAADSAAPTNGAGNEEPITVASVLEDPHELVNLSAAALRRTKADDDGIARCRDRRCLSIEVAPASVDRALRIMDALIKALVARGLEVEVREPAVVSIWTPSVTRRDERMPLTLLRVDGESVPIAIEELTESVQVDAGDSTRWRLPKYESRATGKLRLRVRDDVEGYQFRLGVQKNWTDTDRRPIEASLTAFARGLHTIAAAIKRARIEDERHRKEQEEWQRKWKLEREQKEMDDRRRKRVDDEVPRWRLARDLREYVLAIREVIEEGGCSVIPGGELDEWLRWCDGYALRIDPLSPLRQEIARARTEGSDDDAKNGEATASDGRSSSAQPVGSPPPATTDSGNEEP